MVCDGSSLGLGFVLYQNKTDEEERSVVQIGSTGLKERESRNSPVELESMAIRFGLKKADHYLRACPKFKIITDCKAIPSNMREIVNIRNSKLQRLMTDLQEYNYEIVHIAGRNNGAADALSRDPLPGTFYTDDMIEEAEENIIMNNIFICQANVEERADVDSLEDLNMIEIIKFAGEDEEYQKLMEAFKQGKLPKELGRDHPIRAWSGSWETVSLLTESGPLVIDGEKVILPKGIQKKVVKQLHERTHGTAGRMIETIGESMIWKNWKSDIQDMVDKCEACKTWQTSKPEGAPRVDKIPLTSLSPMDILHADLFQYQGSQYLSVRDQVSTYTFMFELRQTDSRSIIKKLEELMAEFGRMKKIITDGAPNLDSQEFNDFCKSRNIIHQVSSPYSPTSNYCSELGVKRCKHSLRRSTITGDSAQKLLKQSQELCLSDCGASPKSLFLKRRIDQDSTIEALRKPFDWKKEIQQREDQRMKRILQDQRKGYKKGFETGQRVRVQETIAKGKQWKELGTITEQTDGKDSFMIEMDNGEIIRRHKRFIREERGEESDQEIEKAAEGAKSCTKREELTKTPQEREPICDRVLRKRPV